MSYSILYINENVVFIELKRACDCGLYLGGNWYGSDLRECGPGKRYNYSWYIEVGWNWMVVAMDLRNGTEMFNVYVTGIWYVVAGHMGQRNQTSIAGNRGKPSNGWNSAKALGFNFRWEGCGMERRSFWDISKQNYNREQSKLSS